jgi:hypothetical protein
VDALPRILIAASAGILLTLGALHLLYTFFGPKLRPRDSELEAHMQRVHLVITRQTTVWRAWIGFNASHSLGIILFGLLYGYLALARPEVLFGSVFLSVLGGVFLGSYVILAFKYWFSVPFRGVALAFILYSAALVMAWIAGDS